VLSTNRPGTPVEKILFLILQQRQAEAAGLKRNIVNRNLKVSIKQYWSNDFLGQNELNKSAYPRSRGAAGLRARMPDDWDKKDPWVLICIQK
jgi:hypothetical protein